MAHLDIRYTLPHVRLQIPFEKMAHGALPTNYQLSLVICGDRLAQRMNAEYRKKTYKPNVLSFSLSKTEGEIFLNVRKAEREARNRGMSVRAHLAHLFVHGCLHLDGHKHGTAMESLEEKILRKFTFR